MKLWSKGDLVDAIKTLFDQGWHPSVKATIDRRNDGAVGNTLEHLLGITENNLPVPNASEWELKGKRINSQSLITLKHIEPSPQAAHIVRDMLLPHYGWKHRQAGRKYPASERSFRSTTSANSYTSRGFTVVVDREAMKIRFVFDAAQADQSDPVVSAWMQDLCNGVGLGPLDPEPYWGFQDLANKIASKMNNCFFVTAESRKQGRREQFRYVGLQLLSGFSGAALIDAIESGDVLVDFDARSGHNHGTKFRIRPGKWTALYTQVETVIG